MGESTCVTIIVDMGQRPILRRLLLMAAKLRLIRPDTAFRLYQRILRTDVRWGLDADLTSSGPNTTLTLESK